MKLSHLLPVFLRRRPDPPRCECPIRPTHSLEDMGDPSRHSKVCPIRQAGDQLDREVHRMLTDRPEGFGVSV